ncbi:MAG: HD domain-containing protein [Solirubrobacterales bacterium]
MKRANLILNNEKYKKVIHAIELFEIDRKFCRHDISHFMDVARISYILVLENNINIDKEIVYAAALLHDIGRGIQYRDGVPHDLAGLTLAEEILTETGFNEEEKFTILNAIKYHRSDNKDVNNFNTIFSKSDKLSRNCFNCLEIKNCNWNDEKKNFFIQY